jgi:hypothetical protein
MKQHIVIAVVSDAPAKHLFDRAHEMLAGGLVDAYFKSLTCSDDILFYSQHLDLWSMGDSFERLLRPKSRLQYFDGGSSQLYAIRRDVLQLRASPRDEEERLLRTLLLSAKSFQRRTAREAFLFVLRSVFDASGTSHTANR